MKWKTPTQITDGDKRTVIKFALFPTDMYDGMTIWLERYIATQKFVCGAEGAGWSDLNRTSI